jgi:hypothetical protein
MATLCPNFPASRPPLSRVKKEFLDSRATTYTIPNASKVRQGYFRPVASVGVFFSFVLLRGCVEAVKSATYAYFMRANFADF